MKSAHNNNSNNSNNMHSAYRSLMKGMRVWQRRDRERFVGNLLFQRRLDREDIHLQIRETTLGMGYS